MNSVSQQVTGPSIRGNWATLLLPLNRNDSIDYSLLAAELDYCSGARVDGIDSNGSAGEFYTQTEAEFDQINTLLAQKCARSGMAFQVGACHTSPQIARERIRRVKALRPVAFQLILPDWFVPSWPEIIAFLEIMAAEAAPVPLVLYNPPHAKRRLVPDEWQKLAATIPGLVGMKVPGGDDTWYTAMQPVMKTLSVFIPGHLLHEGLRRGAHGAYSNVACLSPRGAQWWTDLCRRDPRIGAQVGARVFAFWNAHVAPLISQHQLSNMAADKATAVAGGWLPHLSSRLRWPYRSAVPEQCAAIGKAARATLPEFFESS